MKKSLLFLIALIISFQVSQADEFSLEKYHEFLSEHEDISSSQLYEMYPPGRYAKEVRYNLSGVDHLKEIDDTFNLTSDEKKLLERQAFMVSSRLSYDTHMEAITDYYRKDMPLFITTDMILHAFHKGYDELLKNLEKELLIKKVTEILEEGSKQIENLDKEYASNTQMLEIIKDLDIYYTVARNLNGSDNKDPFYSDNEEKLGEILSFIELEKPASFSLLGTGYALFDFSQFKPRGHYAKAHEFDVEGEALEKYFQTVMWLSKCEMRVGKNKGLVTSLLVQKIMQDGKQIENFKYINDLLVLFIGAQDNITLTHISEMVEENNITDPSLYLEDKYADKLRKYMEEKEFPGQYILSQLMKAPSNSDKTQPLPNSFMLIGQRFILDSYIFHNLVFDRIVYKGNTVKRYMPSTYDMLFVLGNDAVSHFLKGDLNEYNYSDNLAALRYLKDSFEDSYWNSSVYNNWLNFIMSMNPPSLEERQEMPLFMQTAAWWQHKANTQLASWSQLRHDNLLYAKQSYSSYIFCDYPHIFVEPEIDFWEAMIQYSKKMSTDLTLFVKENPNGRYINLYLKYLETIEEHLVKLKEISRKELNKEKLNGEEFSFLKSTLEQRTDFSTCNPNAPKPEDGWYSDFYFPNYKLLGTYDAQLDNLSMDFIIADVHTNPGEMAAKGEVKHAATGKINTAIIIVEDENGMPRAYLGPVMSYYEIHTLGYQRLTDQEWEAMVISGSEKLKPSPHTDIYLCDTNGVNEFEYPMILPTFLPGNVEETDIENIDIDVYPQPAKDIIYVRFDSPIADYSDLLISLYDIQGNKVSDLVNKSNILLAKRNNQIQLDLNSINLLSGNYIIQIEINSTVISKKIVIKK